MPTRDVHLSEHFDSLIEDSIRSGRFVDASEVVSEALSLLEEREAEEKVKLDWLRHTAGEAFQSLDQGQGAPLNSAEDVTAMVSRALEAARSRRHTHA